MIKRLGTIVGVGLLALLIFGAVPAWAVTPSGPVCTVNASGGADYTAIQAAVNNTNCTTINVAPGTYNENINITHSLTLQSTAGAASTTILGTGSTAAVTISADGVTIDGFTIKNPSGAGDTLGIYARDYSNLTIKNNIVTNIGNGTTKAIGIVVLSLNSAVSTITITNNQISQIAGSGASASGISIGWHAGTQDITGLLIQNNIISNISTPPAAGGAYGILLDHGTAGGQTIGAQVLDNTISNIEGLWAHAIGLEGDTPNALVQGNTISNVVDHSSLSDAVAVHVEDNPSASTVAVHLNNFESVNIGVNRTGSSVGTVDATNNWWGCVTGPNTAGCATASANVNFTPFLGASVSSAASHTGPGTLLVNNQIGPGSSVTVNGGTATLTVAQYSSNPGSGFAASGNFVDVHLSNIIGVTSVIIKFCPANSNTTIFFFNGAGWLTASNQQFDGAGCVIVTITPGSTPNLNALTGLALAPGGPGPGFPSLNEWGLLILGLLLMSLLAWTVRRRRGSVSPT